MKNNRVSRIRVLAALLMFAIGAGSAHANGIADGKIAETYQNLAGQRTSIDTSAIDNTHGREKKAENAQNTANTGKAAAAATGAALIATGTPMLGSIIAAVRAAGAELVAKGITELAQAAASGNAGDKNEAQKDLLLANVDGGVGAAPPGGNAVQLPPDLEAQLRQQGVNPDAFLQDALAGNMNDANDVLKAMGLPQVSGDDLAKGQAMASEQLGQELGKVPTAQLQTNENAKPGSTSVSGGGSGGALGGALGGNEGLGAPGGAYLVENHGPAGAGAALAGAAGGAEGEDGDAKSAKLAALGFKLGGDQDAQGAGRKGVTRITRAQMTAIGVLPPQPKQNLFQIAHRNYRSYGKWRQSKISAPRLAQK